MNPIQPASVRRSAGAEGTTHGPIGRRKEDVISCRKRFIDPAAVIRSSFTGLDRLFNTCIIVVAGFLPRPRQLINARMRRTASPVSVFVHKLKGRVFVMQTDRPTQCCRIGAELL